MYDLINAFFGDIDNSILIYDIYTLIEGLGTSINVVLKNWSKII